MRLDKLLSHAGYGSRSEANALVRAGRVQVDGALARDAAMGVSPDACVRVDGADAGYRPVHLLMMNKPAGLLTATRDPKAPTVLDLLAPAHRKSGVFPVGRLDKDVTGLLLLTNDGQLGHRLLSPASGTVKVYEALCASAPAANAEAAFAAGLPLYDFTARPAVLRRLSPAQPCLVRVDVTEGRFHQVKRMLAAVGAPVVTLKRLAIGGVWLDESLPPGAFRPLTLTEEAALRGDGHA